MRIRAVLSVAVVVLCSGACRDRRHPRTPPPNAAVQARVDAASPALCGDRFPRDLTREVKRFYQQHGYQTIWSDGRRASSRVNDLAQALRHADGDGLDPSAYDPAALDTLASGRLDEARAVEFDVQATCRYLLHAGHLSRGTIDPKEVDRQWKRTREEIDTGAAL